MRSEFTTCIGALARRAGAGPPALPEDLGGGMRWYPASWQDAAGAYCFAARDGAQEYLVCVGRPTEVLPGELLPGAGVPVRVAPRGPEACAALRGVLPYTAPSVLPAGRPSLGCGDRLGVAGPGHIRALRGYDVSLVLAQQSARELTLTRRTYRDVLDAATWAVFREGCRRPWGADGDHLKRASEVEQMLDAGATFITLDLSLCLGRSEEVIEPPRALARLAGTTWADEGVTLALSEGDVRRFWQLYGPAFLFIEDADTLCRQARGAGRYDLEVSVDEIPEVTRPADHLLLALELRRRGVGVTSIAPRFPGEFQKGIDYVGSLDALEGDMALHAAIARHFGHRLGVHSGSDKFSAFPAIGRRAQPWLHLKTAGTSWLEALRVVAGADPALFRACWALAAAGFSRALQYYHIRTTPADVAGADVVPDEALPDLLDQDAPRQFLHVTYGEILKAPAGGGTLGDLILSLLAAHEDAYMDALGRHFRRHAEALGLKKGSS